MYKRLLIAAIVAMPVLSWIVPQTRDKPEIPRKQVVNKIDPVCGMALHKADIADTTIYNGKVIGFCSHNCKVTFAANPAKYPVAEK